ncbi:MAG: hypothetical protein RLZZ213_1508 [Cyanobacteriota bacterium]
MVPPSSAKDRLKRRLLGNPLPRDQEEARTVPSFQALPILSSDAALGVLILAGSGALSFSLPITITIVALIAIVVPRGVGPMWWVAPTWAPWPAWWRRRVC